VALLPCGPSHLLELPAHTGIYSASSTSLQSSRELLWVWGALSRIYSRVDW
jgi:hypothetical protein